MKLTSTLDRRPGLLHLAPLLDVIVLMVLFYLLSTTLIHQSGIAVELPVSPSQLPPLPNAHRILVAGDANAPQVFWDWEQTSVPALLDRLRKHEDSKRSAIYLRADRRMLWGTIIDITNAAQLGGYEVVHVTDFQPVAETTSDATK